MIPGKNIFRYYYDSALKVIEDFKIQGRYKHQPYPNINAANRKCFYNGKIT